MMVMRTGTAVISENINLLTSHELDVECTIEFLCSFAQYLVIRTSPNSRHAKVDLGGQVT